MKRRFRGSTIQTEVDSGIGIISLKLHAPGALEKCKQAIHATCL